MTLNCPEALERLHARLDGQLAEVDRLPLERHLEACEGCRREAAELEILRVETSRLAAEILPARGLWPDIEPRLVRSWRHHLHGLAAALSVPYPTPLLAAGAAVLALALGVWLWRVEPAPRASAPVAAETTAGGGRDMSAQAQRARSEDGALLAHQDLVETLQMQTDRLSPETVAVVEENMRIIDQAIGQIRTALEDDPLNPRLNMLLAARYQREAQLLMRVSGV